MTRTALALFFVFFVLTDTEGPIHGTSSTTFEVTNSSFPAFGAHETSIGEENSLQDQSSGYPDLLSQRDEDAHRNNREGASPFEEGRGKDDRSGYGDERPYRQGERGYGERYRRGERDMPFGGDEGFGGDEEFGRDDEGFGGDEGFRGDEGYGGDDEEFGGDGAFGGDQG
jgi:hypothetical protein